MRFKTVWACAVFATVGFLAGCNGSIGIIPTGTGGSGTGNNPGPGSGGSGAVGSNSGTGGTVGTAGSGSPAGTAGSSATGTGGAPSSSVLDLSGTPKYYRAIKLSNSQWAQAVQTVLNTPSGGLESVFSTPSSDLTDFSNNELVLGLDSRNWSDFQTAAETLAA